MFFIQWFLYNTNEIWCFVRFPYSAVLIRNHILWTSIMRSPNDSPRCLNSMVISSCKKWDSFVYNLTEVFYCLSSLDIFCSWNFKVELEWQKKGYHFRSFECSIYPERLLRNISIHRWKCYQHQPNSIMYSICVISPASGKECSTLPQMSSTTPPLSSHYGNMSARVLSATGLWTRRIRAGSGKFPCKCAAKRLVIMVMICRV